MNYTDIRQHVQSHFRELLVKFRAKIAEDGPYEDSKLDGLTAAQSFAGDDLMKWLDTLYADQGDQLIQKFCNAHGIQEELSAPNRRLLLKEFHKAHRVYLDTAVSHNSGFDNLELE